MIIGITGWTASGKDTVGDYLVNKGFKRFSFSDYLREELTRRGIPLTRDNLRNTANAMRHEFGFAFIAEKAVKLINESKNENWVLLSVRLPSEVEYLRKHLNFLLLNIFVPDQIRYKRALSRARIGEKDISFDSFIAKEIAERSGQNNSQEVDRVIEMADQTIENSGTLEELYYKVNTVLEKD